MQNHNGLLSGKRKYVLGIAAALCCLAVVGGTLAFLLMGTPSLSNRFTPAQVLCEVVEDPFDGVTKTNVAVKNTGNVTAYIRAAVIVTWMPADNDPNAQSVLASRPVEGTDYDISFGDGWIRGADGYYYCRNTVDPGATTPVLIRECKMKEGAAAPEGYVLAVEIVSSAIQATPRKAVKDTWGVTLTDGQITGQSGKGGTQA